MPHPRTAPANESSSRPSVPLARWSWLAFGICLFVWVGCGGDALDTQPDAALLDASSDPLDTQPDAAMQDGSIDTVAPSPDAALHDTSTTDGEDSPPDVDSGSSSVARSAGCGTPQAARFECFEEMFEGRMRSWCLNIPEGYDSNRVHELVIGLHGCGGNNQAVHNHRAPMEANGANEFLFVYPQAAESCWDYESVVREGNDASFIQYMVAEAHAMTCLDTERTFVHGMSSGGSMAPRVVSAGIAIGFGCTSGAGSVSSPTPAWYFAGRSDESYSLISGSAESQVSVNRCSTETTPIEGTPCVRYEGCAAPMVYCEDDRGHVWPREEWAQGGILDVFRGTP